MQPVKLIQCNVDSGDCHFIALEEIHFFKDSVADLRGGTPFYHYRDNYFVSFARTRDDSMNKCLQTYYRPVFTIVEFSTEGNVFTPIFVSAPFDFFGLPQRAIVPDADPTNCAEWKYMLPYSLVMKDDTMHLTLNIADKYNVVVSFSNVTANIDALIEAHKRSASKIPFDYQQKLDASSAAKSLVFDNLFACIEGHEVFARQILHVSEPVAREASRLCLATRSLNPGLAPPKRQYLRHP